MSLNDSTQFKLQTEAEILAFLRNWLVPVDQHDKRNLMSILTGPVDAIGQPFITLYLKLLEPYLPIFEPQFEKYVATGQLTDIEFLASGLVFFYGCLCYIMHFPAGPQQIENIFLYNLLYLLVDNYIDNHQQNSQTKATAIQQMTILVKEPARYQELKLADPVLQTIAQIYQKLLTACPSVKAPMVKLLMIEIKGAAIQQQADLPRSVYHEISLQKGGYTMEVLACLVMEQPIDQSVLKATYQMGTIMQLIDDSIDVANDQGQGIHTIASHDLATYGNLNKLWLEIINRIEQIDRRFVSFIILYTVFAVYIVGREPTHYSQSLRQLIEPFNLFDYQYGCDGAAMLSAEIFRYIQRGKKSTESFD